MIVKPLASHKIIHRRMKAIIIEGTYFVASADIKHPLHPKRFIPPTVTSLVRSYLKSHGNREAIT